jgi:hypothetical protein
MTTMQLIILRVYMFSLGRIGFFAKNLRKVLVGVLIRNSQKDRYTASSKFFNIKELD